MRFARFFVDRPIFATVLSLVITLLGSIAFLNLPVAQYPEIAPPTIVVRASYPGADAATVAATVAAPLEEQINGVENMLYMSSFSGNDGALALTITFRLGTDLNAAQVLVQNRVSTAMARLPQAVTQLGVTTNKTSPDIMMVVHLLSPDETYDQLYVSNYARNRVRDILLRLDGVGDVIIFGERLYSLRIWLDPDRLATYGLTSGDAVAAVREQNIQVSGGALGAQPAPRDNAFQLTVRTQGRFQEPAEFERIVVRSTSEGRIVRLGDVARIELGAQDYATGSYLNGKAAVGVAVFQRPNTNALAAAKGIVEMMERLRADFPAGIEYRIVYNPTQYIQASMDAVYRTLIEAIVLVVLVILVFLQSWRTAVIPIIAIPVSLIGTFAVMAALGYSLNNLTLFGLVLAIGIVVDDAIVVVENVERNIALGLSPHAASHRSMDEVGTAVIAIALVLAAVFVPTAFIPGITGQFYRQFAMTIAVSTVISAFVSLTLSPALTALLLKPHDAHPGGNPLTRLGRKLADGFNRGFDAVADAYARAVALVARGVLLALAVYGGLIGLTVWLAMSVPTGFIPAQDQGYVIVVVQLPDGASLSRTEAAMKKVAAIVGQTPGVANTVEIAGLNGATFTNASNSGVVFGTLKPFAERAALGQTSLSIIGQLGGRLSGIEEAFVIAVPPPPVRGLGSQGGFKIQLQDRDGADVRRVLGAAYAMMGAAQRTPGLVGVFTTFTANTPQVFLEIDRVKARMLNVPIGAIFEALQNNLGSAYVNDFNAFGRVYQVRLQADERFRLERERIGRLRVRSADGALVPLGTLVEMRDIAGPSLVQRFNMYTSVPLQGNAAPGTATSEALATMERLAAEHLPPGIGFEWTELAFQERATGNAAYFIFGLSVVFVFLVLAAQYESWALPLSIVLIVPMSVMSALLGVMARGMDNNILTQVGLVVLIGLAAKNAILIVEFARQAEERDGKGPIPAVIEACRLRLRPILMTAFAFIFGVIPLATATGAGAEMRQALGTAVLFGMIGVTFFGLFLTPAFYVALRWLSLKLKPEKPATPASAQGEAPAPTA